MPIGTQRYYKKIRIYQGDRTTINGQDVSRALVFMSLWKGIGLAS